MRETGYVVTNTVIENLNVNFSLVGRSKEEDLSFIETFERLLAPFNAIKEIKSTKLGANILLKPCFSPAYQSKTDLWYCHCQEIEDRQLNCLLKKLRGRIIDQAKWTNPIKNWNHLFTQNFHSKI